MSSSAKNREDEEMAENIPLEPCDNLESKSSTMESERDSDVKEEPESSTASTLWDTYKAMGTRTRSRPGSSRRTSACFTCTNAELLVFRDKIAAVTSRMVDVFDKSENQLLKKLELQAKSCSSLKDVTQYFAIMGNLIDSLKRQNSVRATTPRDGLQSELVKTKLKMEELQQKYKLNLDMKTNELKLAEEKCKNLEKSQQDATNRLKMLNQDLSEQKQLLNKVLNAYILTNESKEPCPKNSSTFANRSIRSGFLQTDDEDVLNRSSLPKETRLESKEPSDDRLTEIRRRNILCLPHMKSSYALEMQNMTPTEKKYFEIHRPQAVDDDIDSVVDFNEAPRYPGSKRKVTDMEDTSSQPARLFLIKPRSMEKPTTPLRKMFYKGKTFKTPTSIRSLMGGIPRK